MNMDYEKKYKEALSKAKDMLSYKEVRREDMEYLFPELKVKESEDEQVRKEIIEFLQDCNAIDSGYFKKYCKTTIEKMIAWLEKQGEQKPTWRPSKAQMVALHATQSGVIGLTTLQSLYNDLEKL